MKKKAASLPSIHDYALVADAARAVGLPVSTVKEWAQSGKLTMTEWHGKWLVLLDDVRALQKTRPTMGRPKKAE